MAQRSGVQMRDGWRLVAREGLKELWCQKTRDPDGKPLTRYEKRTFVTLPDGTRRQEPLADDRAFNSEEEGRARLNSAE